MFLIIEIRSKRQILALFPYLLYSAFYFENVNINWIPSLFQKISSQIYWSQVLSDIGFISKFIIYTMRAF